MIGIINYGMGNLKSVKNALDYLEIQNKIIDTPKELSKIDKLILPGVGAFGIAMENLDKAGFSLAIKESVIVKQKPILGICLGMQLLLSKSYEHGMHSGLDLIKGEVVGFKGAVKNLSVPHIGWNEMIPASSNSLVKQEKEKELNFYFVHSFYCKLENEHQVSGTTEYGINFHSALEYNHIFGCQFHPEKSQNMGLTIFSAFDKI